MPPRGASPTTLSPPRLQRRRSSLTGERRQPCYPLQNPNQALSAQRNSVQVTPVTRPASAKDGQSAGTPLREKGASHGFFAFIAEAPAGSAAGFLGLLAAAALACLLLVGLFNYVINPAGVFAPSVVPALLWNPRGEKLVLLSAVRQPPQLLVLGSSRVMKLAPRDLERETGLVAFNGGVSSAAIEDDVAMLHFAMESRRLPLKLVILGIEPESFATSQPSNWWMWPPAVTRALPWRMRVVALLTRYQKLFSASYLRLSLDQVYLVASGRRPSPAQRLDPDGLVHWLDREEDMAHGNRGFDSRLAAHVRDFGTPFMTDSTFSEERWREFGEMLARTRTAGVQTIVFMTPVHPELMARLPRGYAAWHAEVARRARSMSLRHGADFRDFTDPSSFGGLSDDFFDGVHYDDRNAVRLVRALLRPGRDAVQ